MNLLFSSWVPCAHCLILSVCPHAEKFNIEGNNHGCKLKCIFFCLRLEIPILGTFGPKNQNCPFKLKYFT